MTTTLANIAWAAGIFEGEGSISKLLCNSQKGYCLAISMTDKDVIERFYSIVGVGRLYGPYGHKKGSPREGYKPYYRWAVASKDGVLHINALFDSWLGERRKAKMAEAVAAANLIKPKKLKVANPSHFDN